MRKDTSCRLARWCVQLKACLQLVLLTGLMAAVPVLAADDQKDTYDQDSIIKDAT